MANEQLEFLRLRIFELEDRPKELAVLALEHFPKLIELCKQVSEARPEENRTTILLSNLATLISGWDKSASYSRRFFMQFVDEVCRIRQLTNVQRVRILIDNYQGGWDGSA